jgi:hypothetical protein
MPKLALGIIGNTAGEHCRVRNREGSMTEEQIENRVCAMCDDLDKRFLSSNSMTADEYEKRNKAIQAWAETEYRRRYPNWDNR